MAKAQKVPKINDKVNFFILHLLVQFGYSLIAYSYAWWLGQLLPILKSSNQKRSLRFESRHFDGGIVNKYIPTVVLCDETKSLFFTKPFYSSLCHTSDLLLEIS